METQEVLDTSYAEVLESGSAFKISVQMVGIIIKLEANVN